MNLAPSTRRPPLRPPRPSPPPNPQPLIFREVEGWEKLDPAARIRAFLELDAEARERGYARVRDYKRPPPAPVFLREGDVRLDDLLAVDTPTYFELLAGVEVPDRGRVSCPLPDHEDVHPSCVVYPGDRGWYCHGCNTGGNIITLGSALSGISRRGADFPRLLEWIAERLR